MVACDGIAHRIRRFPLKIAGEQDISCRMQGRDLVCGTFVRTARKEELSDFLLERHGFEQRVCRMRRGRLRFRLGRLRAGRSCGIRFAFAGKQRGKEAVVFGVRQEGVFWPGVRQKNFSGCAEQQHDHEK